MTEAFYIITRTMIMVEVAHPQNSSQKLTERGSKKRRRCSASLPVMGPEISGDENLKIANDALREYDCNADWTFVTSDDYSFEGKATATFSAHTKPELNTVSGGFSIKGRKQGKQHWINQDCFKISETFDENEEFLDVYNVCDGHGKNGHVVATCVSGMLPDILRRTGYDQKKSLQRIHSELSMSAVDAETSGCTCLTTIINKKTRSIEVGNVGDSRCLLIRRSSSGDLEPLPLSTDQKPSDLHEKRRITEAGGIVYGVNGGAERVWFTCNQMSIGLAMSRSVGDLRAHEHGVSHEPQIHCHSICNNDVCLILASDGLWDIFQNEQVRDFVNSYIHVYGKELWNPADLARYLAESARLSWEKFSPYNIDDITVVIVRLDT